LALQRPGDRVLPMARALSPKECARSPQIRDHAAELKLEHLRVPHRHRRLHLPPAGSRKVDEIAYDPFGHTKHSGSMKKGEELRESHIERPGHEWHAAVGVRKIRGTNHFVLQ